MTLRQVEYLLTVLEEQSFTRASERLNITQSGLSQQIQSLERAVGASLLERLPRGVRLTPAGDAYVRHARSALLADRRARRAVSDVVNGHTGRLEIATVLSVAVGVLPASIARLHRESPGVSINLFEFEHRGLLEQAVAAGTADVAIGPRPLSWNGPVTDLGVERFVIVLPPGDALGAKIVPYRGSLPTAAPRSVGVLALSELESRDWIMPAPQNGLSDLIHGHLTAAGLLSTRVTLRTSQTEAAARLGAAGVGVALLPANVVPRDLRALICEPDPPLTRTLAVYARSAFTPAVEFYLSLVKQEPAALDPL